MIELSKMEISPKEKIDEMIRIQSILLARLKDGTKERTDAVATLEQLTLKKIEIDKEK
jgi:hypothetical protein